MNVSMLLVDKGSGRYSYHAEPASVPDVVLSLPLGKCAHYYFKMDEETKKSDRVLCGKPVSTNKATGLLCEFHQSQLHPMKRLPVVTVPVDARNLLIYDRHHEKATDLRLHDARSMRHITNKRPKNDWDAPLDSFIAFTKEMGWTTAAVRQHLTEELGWELFDPRTVYVLKQLL